MHITAVPSHQLKIISNTIIAKKSTIIKIFKWEVLCEIKSHGPKYLGIEYPPAGGGI